MRFFSALSSANLIAIHLIASTLINKFLPIFVFILISIFFFINYIYIKIGCLFGSHKFFTSFTK